jgi:AcrR family transcriptional regulator
MAHQSAELRRRQRSAEARHAILDAASSILIEDGYANFTMRNLADRCGYTAPTIYNHFGDKTGLIDALLDEVFSELVSILEGMEPAADPLDRMRGQFVAFVSFALRNPTHYRLLTTLREGDAEPPASGDRAVALLEEPMRALSESGRLKVADIEAVQQSFWALLHGLISLQTSRPDHGWSDALVETSLEAMIEGLIRSEARPVARIAAAEAN